MTNLIRFYFCSRFFNKANIENLTDAVLMKIFGHLDHQDLASVAQVCSRWNHLVKVGCAVENAVENVTMEKINQSNCN